jgi:hypothetical protein
MIKKCDFLKKKLAKMSPDDTLLYMDKNYYSKNHYKVGGVKFTLDHDGLEQAIDYAFITKMDVECIRNGEFTEIVFDGKIIA